MNVVGISFTQIIVSSHPGIGLTDEIFVIIHGDISIESAESYLNLAESCNGTGAESCNGTGRIMRRDGQRK